MIFSQKIFLWILLSIIVESRFPTVILVCIPLTEVFEFTRNKNSEFNLRALDSLNSAVLVWDKQERYEMRLNLASPAGEVAQSIELFCFVRNISPAFNL